MGSEMCIRDSSWSAEGVAFVNAKHGRLTYAKADTVAARIAAGHELPGERPRRGTSVLAQTLERKGETVWQASSGEKFEVISLAPCPNAIAAGSRSASPERRGLFRPPSGLGA